MAFAAAASANPHSVNRCALGADERCRLPNRELVIAGMPMRMTTSRKLFTQWISSRCTNKVEQVSCLSSNTIL